MGTRIERLTSTDVSPDGSANRYNFDWSLCSYKKGWAQIDTTEDAEWWGNWANPTRRMIVNFAEGDVTIWHCDTDEDFVATMKERIADLERLEYKPAVDAMCQPNIIARFNELGLGELLH